MKFLKLPDNPRFTNKALILFFLPIVLEQFMMAGLNIADTFMVSSIGDKSISDAIVAGVANVNRIDTFAKQFFLAMAQGGSVLLSMYIGAKDQNQAERSLKTNIHIVLAFGFALTTIMLVFKTQIINLLFGNADTTVLEYSYAYFTVTALSYPFISLYYAGTASFRAMGESKIPSIAAVMMMVINLVLKALFIYVFELGVQGAALSTLIAMGITGFTLMFMLGSKKRKVPLRGIFKIDFGGGLAKRILGVSIPNGLENAMFQLGALLIASLIAGLGTASIAADQLARNVSPIIHSIGAGFSAVAMMVVGQCMGAGRPDEATMYTKHILKLDYLFTLVQGVFFMLILWPLISIFNVSDEAKNLAFWIMVLYIVGSCLFYPTSFMLASALRGAGDTKYVMYISSASMLLFRVAAAYALVYFFDLGVISAWVAMISDWVIRTVIFIIRFARGKWKNKKVI